MNHKIERDEVLAKWQRECEGNSVPVTPMMRHAYRDGWDDALASQSRPDARADERGALMCERLRAMGLNTANEAADLIEQMGRAAAPQAEAAQGVPEGWTRNHEADSALIMLDRLDVSSDDDVRVDAISAIVRKLAAAPSAHAAVAGELIYQVRAETWGRQWSDVPKSIFDKKAALEGWKVRIVYTIPQALAAAPAPVGQSAGVAEGWRELCRRLYVELFHCDQQMRSTRDQDGEPHWTQSAVVRDVLKDAKAALAAPSPDREQVGEAEDIPPIMYNGETKRDPALRELLERQARRHILINPRGDAPPSRERGGQDCPHGVDDGACKQCYGEAVRGSCPDGSVCEIGCFGECEKRAASAPTLALQHVDDAAVDSFACAMKEKMATARAKGRSGWEGMDPAELSRMLREHVEKGDPRDVANFCMMLWHHGTQIAASAPTLSEIDWREKFFAEQRARMELEAALHLVVEDKPQPKAAEPKGLSEPAVHIEADREEG